MPTRGALTRDGTELVYWTWPGASPPALLLHGIGNYGRYWDLFADAIAGRLQLVAPDARGHGESGKPADGYAPADFAADALAILDRLGIERAAVVGHSMGGLHSINLAARHPERVQALVIVDASPEPLPQGAERAQRLLTGRPARFADRRGRISSRRRRDTRTRSTRIGSLSRSAKRMAGSSGAPILRPSNGS